MKGSVRKIIPLPIKRFVRIGMNAMTAWCYRTHLAFRIRRLKARKDCVAVSFGEVFVPGQPGVINGGRVKLIHLAEHFVYSMYGFDILYIVSSALFPHVGAWVRSAKRAGRKVVWNQNGVAYPAWAGPDYDGMNKVARELIAQADYVIYQSRFCKEGADKYLRVLPERYSIVHNCVDTDFFIPRAEAEQKSGELRLLVIGTHNRKERVFGAIDAIEELLGRGTKAHLTIAGKLNWNERAEQETRERLRPSPLKFRTDIVGAFKQDQAVDMYRKSDILLHLQYNDACPTVPMEAMACGVPVVGLRSGGMPEIVKENSGILINVEQSYEREYFPSSKEIADAVVAVAKDREWYGKNARSVAVRYFGKEQWLGRHDEIFKSL